MEPQTSLVDHCQGPYVITRITTYPRDPRWMWANRAVISFLALIACVTGGLLDLHPMTHVVVNDIVPLSWLQLAGVFAGFSFCLCLALSRQRREPHLFTERGKEKIVLLPVRYEAHVSR